MGLDVGDLDCLQKNCGTRDATAVLSVAVYTAQEPPVHFHSHTAKTALSQALQWIVQSPQHTRVDAIARPMRRRLLDRALRGTERVNASIDVDDTAS